MNPPLRIAFFGSSLVSSYWNGAATYYRGILHALAQRGHHITFYEPDAFGRQEHRDLDDPDWARVVVYSPDDVGALRALVREAGTADLLVKASGVGVHDALLEQAVLEQKSRRTKVIFWDVDAPVTLERLSSDPADPFTPLIPQYDFILTYGGGQPVVDAYEKNGARLCVPIYNALDPRTHHPVPRNDRFACDLAFLGNRLPDRESRVDEFFLNVAHGLPEKNFILGGSGWGDKPIPPNIRYLGHVFTADHNAFNCTPTAVLNISRDSMARLGFSPATRVFEAAGAGACIITDAWDGIGNFLEPGSEVLVATNGAEVAALLDELGPERAAAIGEAARRRMLREHTYQHRVAQLENLLLGKSEAPARPLARTH
jgi:spore maturation protein CgeB